MSIVSGTIAGLAGADASKQASQNAANAQNNATALQERIYNENKANFQPYLTASQGEIPVFQNMLSGNYDMNQSPAARYQLTAGTKALNLSLAARGMAGGGTAANRLTELSSNIAGSDWNNQYSRILDALKLGTGAASSMGAASNTLGNQAQAGAANLGNIFNQQGANQASLYSGMGGLSSNAAATGLRAYQASQAGSAGSQNNTFQQYLNGYGDANGVSGADLAAAF